MNIYTRKKRWKWALFATAITIIAISLYYTNVLVRKIAQDERSNVRIWADAIQRKANLVEYTELFFEQIGEEEKKRAEVLAKTYEIIDSDKAGDDLTFYVDIIRGNTTIPVVLTDQAGNIINYVNIEFDVDTVKKLEGALLQEYSQNPPIRINLYAGKHNILYYKDSKLFAELRVVLDDLIESFISEVLTNAASVPVIVTDSSQQTIINHGNLDERKMQQDSTYITKLLEDMRDENDPIVFVLPNQGARYIFYTDSALLTQLRFYPVVQFGIISLFLLIAYVLFSTARKSEQNQVWVGMSKETAHQLGTPLSSMIAWIELLKMKGVEDEAVLELEKDVNRLENITERFSKIGSAPKLETENIVDVIYQSIDYLKSRTSKKVVYKIGVPADQNILVPLNKNLFSWVIENLCKNAVDAMGGVGVLKVSLEETDNAVHIDFTDTGKGITKGNFKSVFNPGFTSKKRGWGLGLTLSKRIIENYHRGKIFVKSSVIDYGTTFRITLRK